MEEERVWTGNKGELEGKEIGGRVENVKGRAGGLFNAIVPGTVGITLSEKGRRVSVM